MYMLATMSTIRRGYNDDIALLLFAVIRLNENSEDIDPYVCIYISI